MADNTGVALVLMDQYGTVINSERFETQYVPPVPEEEETEGEEEA